MHYTASTEIYLVFADARANSNKFWRAIAHADGRLQTTWGRVGYAGQSKTYNYNSYSQALNKLNTLATAKKQKGYQESKLESPEQLEIRKALELLETIKLHVQNKSFYNCNYIKALNEYLTIIPTPLGMKIDPALLYRSTTDVDRQTQILQKLLSQNPAIAKHNQEYLQEKQTISLKSISNLFWKL